MYIIEFGYVTCVIDVKNIFLFQWLLNSCWWLVYGYINFVYITFNYKLITTTIKLSFPKLKIVLLILIIWFTILRESILNFQCFSYCMIAKFLCIGLQPYANITNTCTNVTCMRAMRVLAVTRYNSAETWTPVEYAIHSATRHTCERCVGCCLLSRTCERCVGGNDYSLTNTDIICSHYNIEQSLKRCTHATRSYAECLAVINVTLMSDIKHCY